MHTFAEDPAAEPHLLLFYMYALLLMTCLTELAEMSVFVVCLGYRLEQFSVIAY